MEETRKNNLDDKTTHKAASASEEFFNQHLNQFFKVTKTAESQKDYFYKIGKFTILLRFAGLNLVSAMTPALEHLSVKKTETPDLTVMLYDSVSTATKVIPVPWSSDDSISAKEIQWLDDKQIRTAYYKSTGILNSLNFQTNQAIFWINDYNNIPYHESGSPLRAILFWWIRKQGYQFAHAAAVGTNNGGVLLVGKGGSGKSTAALSCLNEEGLKYAGDDYVMITNDEEPFVYSIYSSAKLDPSHAKNFLELLQFASNKDRLQKEKALVFLYKYYKNKISRGFPIHAILVPHVSGKKETTYYKTTPSNALQALAPSTIFQIPGAGADTFQFLGNFTKRIPCYQLESGTDISKIPNAILAILSENMR